MEQVRMLPNNVEAEKSILGSILIENNCMLDIIEKITYQDFYNTNNQFIFRSMHELYKKNEPIDVITLFKQLPAGTVTPSYISELMEIPSWRNYKHHVNIIKELSVKRNLIKAMTNAINDSYNKDKSYEEVISQLNANISSYVDNKSKIYNMQDIIDITLEKAEAAYQAGGKITGLETGFKYLDRVTNGIKRQEVTIIAARPSCGKTAFTLNVMSNISNTYKTLMFQLEMSVEGVGYRLLSRESLVNGLEIQRGKLSDSQWESVISGTEQLKDKKFKLDTQGCLSWETIEARIKKEHLQNGLDIVFVDHLGLIKTPGANRNNEIGDITNRAKALSKELDIAIVFLSQLSRACEQRADHRPILSDLRDSGNIEQDADLIMMLYRDEYYNPDTEDKDILEVNTAKNRNGSIGLTKLFFDRELQAIHDLM